VKKKYDVWDYCFECGKPLTTDMEENKDWFHISNSGEAFPLCKDCFELSLKGKLD